MKIHILSAAISIVSALLLFYILYLPIVNEKQTEINFLNKELNKRLVATGVHNGN